MSWKATDTPPYEAHMQYTLTRVLKHALVFPSITRLPHRLRPLSVAFQAHQLVLWAQHLDPPLEGTTVVDVMTVYTGEAFESGGHWTYIGTTTDPDGLVVHAYYQVVEP